MKRLFGNGRYANVTATVALIIALGGTSYAAVVTLPAKSVGPSQLKKNAVTSAKIKKNAVTSAKIGDGALLEKDFKAGQLPAGPQGAAGEPATRLWAVVDTAGAIVRRSDPAITSADTGASRYDVTFPQNVSNCAWLVSVGPGTGVPTPGEASVGSNGANTVVVFTDTSAGGGSDRAFHLAVFC